MNILLKRLHSHPEYQTATSAPLTSAEIYPSHRSISTGESPDPLMHFLPESLFPPAHIPFMSLTFVFTPQLPSGDSSPDRTLTCRTFCSHLQLYSLHIRAVINQLLYKPCYLCTCPLNTQEILLRSAAGSAGSLVVNVQFLDVYSRDLQPAALEPHVRRKCKLKSSCKGKSKVKEKSFNLNFLQVLHKQLQDGLNPSSRILKQQR